MIMIMVMVTVEGLGLISGAKTTPEMGNGLQDASKEHGRRKLAGHDQS